MLAPIFDDTNETLCQLKFFSNISIWYAVELEVFNHC